MARKTILIAEDDPKMHDLYPQYLGERYEYLHAYNGIDALMLAVDLVPDLIILDISMPLLDGRTVCRKIKGYAKTKEIPVVMVTGKADQSDRLVGFEVGAEDYLDKPVSLEQLARTIEQRLR